ncbi:hypothetical protein CSB07_00905 [Candidatus Gracilibacteria bacterium]|nr:MAG: hypothetical protein CSB07_00905 [Candidatus Gracilibacteria bacterium]PIE85780.1 MAG: hypothetical protein CSA08_00305 [Candidatus Gracilibacteria bacterium]
MKKILSFLIIVLIISSCSHSDKIVQENNNINVKNETFVVGEKQSNYLNVYGNILNNNIKQVNSHINGRIASLNCEVGKRVNPNTLIAKIFPDTDGISYKNNYIQINTLNEQLANQQSIKNSTLLSFDSQRKQLELKKNDLSSTLENLQNSLKNLENQKKLTGNDLSLKLDSIKKQINTLKESKILLEQNKKETFDDILDSIENLKGQIYNTSTKSLNRLDEVFGVSNDKKDLNNKFENYLGAKNHKLKKKVEHDIRNFLNIKGTGLSVYSDKELSNLIKNLSNTLKDASKVMNDSLPSAMTFPEAMVNGLYLEFLGYSDGLLKYKANFDKLRNALVTSGLSFDTKIKKIESDLTSLETQKTTLEDNGTQNSDLTFDNNINSLKTKINSTKTSLENLDEQLKIIADTKNSTIKQIDSQASKLQDAIGKTSVVLAGEELYAEINGTIKQSTVKEGNNIRAGTPICIIVPDNNSLKLQLYSPNILKVGMIFEYFKDGKYFGTGSIISESPVKNNLTQNYIYEGKINFSNFREGDYIDIKVITDTKDNEIWIPLNFIYPKLDGYYVNILNSDKTEVRKVEVGKMNNGEIQILSGLKVGDILE